MLIPSKELKITSVNQFKLISDNPEKKKIRKVSVELDPEEEYLLLLQSEVKWMQPSSNFRITFVINGEKRGNYNTENC